jgi:hypothetical protein
MKYLLIILLEILLVNIRFAKAQDSTRMSQGITISSLATVETRYSKSTKNSTKVPDNCEAAIAYYQDKLEKQKAKAKKKNQTDNLLKALTALVSIAATVFIKK